MLCSGKPFLGIAIRDGKNDGYCDIHKLVRFHGKTETATRFRRLQGVTPKTSGRLINRIEYFRIVERTNTFLLLQGSGM
jgi:hypothetical protein